MLVDTVVSRELKLSVLRAGVDLARLKHSRTLIGCNLLRSALQSAAAAVERYSLSDIDAAERRVAKLKLVLLGLRSHGEISETVSEALYWLTGACDFLESFQKGCARLVIQRRRLLYFAINCLQQVCRLVSRLRWSNERCRYY